MTILILPARHLSILMGVALLAALSAGAEPVALRDKLTNQASKRDNGSAAVLTGRVVLANIYVSDTRSGWTRRARRDVRRRMSSAVGFIKAQAVHYDRHVTVIEVDFDAKYEADVPTEMTADPAWTQKAIAAAGKGVASDCADHLKVEHDAEHVLFVLHVNKPGQSYNLAFSDGIDREYRAERVVCFTRLDNEWPAPAATYAHEILHGFGAGELYFPFDETDSRERVASRIFDDDVMFRVDYQLQRLEIGPYTAYRVGWCDTLDEKYRIFEDPK